MKISKLFHWLYAILMFLPILVFIPNAFYYGFNKEAVAQEKTEQIPVYYESNEVTTVNDMVQGRVYTWIDNYQGVYPSADHNLVEIENNYIISSYFNMPNNITSIFIRIQPTRVALFINYISNGTNSIAQFDITNKPFNFVFKNLGPWYDSNLDNCFTKCDTLYETGTYVSLITNMSITDSMSYAWKSVWQNDLFSWTNNTFLKEPFVYITDLFSIPSDNVLINALSYWLDISIIWLVFDVIMYVPLLTHRWLDKGIVE